MIAIITIIICRSLGRRGLRRRAVATRLLRLWVRIPPGTWMSVSDCPTDCGASYGIYEPQELRGHGPRWAAAPKKKKKSIVGTVDLLMKRLTEYYTQTRHLNCVATEVIIVS
jgi:hypothetical protein